MIILDWMNILLKNKKGA